MAGQKKGIKELEGVATVEQVDAVHEKLLKCYSTERYEDFQGAVEKIVGRFFKGYIVWAALVWIVTIIITMILQKTFNIL